MLKRQKQPQEPWSPRLGRMKVDSIRRDPRARCVSQPPLGMNPHDLFDPCSRKDGFEVPEKSAGLLEVLPRPKYAPEKASSCSRLQS